MSEARAEDIAAVLGHELRNPLASAVTAVSMLREMVDVDDPRCVVVDQVLGELDRLARLTDGWLRLSRTGTVARCAVDVDRLLQRVAERHGAAVVSGPVEVSVEGDAALLERALDNLLADAVQAGASVVRVAAQRLAAEITIHVEDDAGVVPERDRAHIFEAGWSGHGRCGLGLHAAAATVRAHRGRIRCVPIRSGTRFTLQLPLVRSRAAMA